MRARKRQLAGGRPSYKVKYDFLLLHRFEIKIGKNEFKVWFIWLRKKKRSVGEGKSSGIKILVGVINFRGNSFGFASIS